MTAEYQRYIPAVDGLRALAILLILVYHLGWDFPTRWFFRGRYIFYSQWLLDYSYPQARNPKNWENPTEAILIEANPSPLPSDDSDNLSHHHLDSDARSRQIRCKSNTCTCHSFFL